MNRLPRAEAAVIDERKITDYLLSVEHPYGRFKARFFTSFGFRLDVWEDLRNALLRHARDSEVVTYEGTAFGTKYVVDGPLHAPDGRLPEVRAVWFVETGDDRPRFVTVYPV